MLIDNHCHLFLGCPPPELSSSELRGLALEALRRDESQSRRREVLTSWWQSAAVQSVVQAIACSSVAVFCAQTVNAQDLWLHVALRRELNEVGLGLGERVRLFAGLHPAYISEESDVFDLLDAVDEISSCDAGLIAGIGEVGLDKRQGPDLALQVAALEQILEHSVGVHFSYSFHCVGAHAELMRLIERKGPLAGTVHGFNSSVEQGLQYHKHGLRIGLGAALLAPQNQRKFGALLQKVPAEAIALESDYDGRFGLYDGALLEKLERQRAALVSVR